MIQARLMPIITQLLWAQTAPVDDTPWVPLTQWSDIPLGLVAKIIIVPLVVVAVVWAVVRFRTHREGATYNSPRRLFNELCTLHELDWPTRKLLRQLARSRHLEHPARIFVEPAFLEPANLPPPLQPFRVELQRLRMRLF